MHSALRASLGVQPGRLRNLLKPTLGIKCNNFRHIALVTSSGAQQAKQGSPAAETCAKEALLGRRAVPGMVLRQVLRTSFTPSAQSTRHRHGSVRTRRAKAKTRSTTVQSKLRGCCDRRTCCVQFESKSPELYSAPPCSAS